MSKRALIIGGTGFLGRAVVSHLQQNGWDVTSLSRGNKSAMSANLVQIRVDRTQPNELMKSLANTEWELVVDCAAFQRQDAIGAVDALQGRCAHYIFISTDYVYAYNPAAKYPLNEDAAKISEQLYGVRKLECEAYFMSAWEEVKFPVTVLRPPHILGHGKPLGCDPLALRDPKLAERIRSGTGLRLLADGQLLIQPVWNREIAACITHVAGNPAMFGRICNCAGRDTVSTRQYYQIIADLLKTSLLFESMRIDDFVKQSPDRAHVARHRIYDTSLLQKLSGYQPQFGIEAAIADSLALA